jgi:hypothetical protein
MRALCETASRGPVKKGPTAAFWAPLVVALALAFGGCGTPESPSAPGAPDRSQVVAIFSRASADYARKARPDGVVESEGYELRPGGSLAGGSPGETMDGLAYEEMIRPLAETLALARYQPSQDPAATRLLIKVYWGDTKDPSELRPYANRQSSELRDRAKQETDEEKRQSLEWQAGVMQQIEESQHREARAANARILGFPDDLDTRPAGDPERVRLAEELQRARYGVALLAYDFQEFKRSGKERLLWEVRFSIQKSGNDFERAFPLMAYSAAAFAGRTTPGVVHRILGREQEVAAPAQGAN